MELLDLDMKKFGKFSDHRITFGPGINIIYGGNETGKTTVSSFIRAMFFGLSRGRGRAANLDEYQLRQPWDSPGAFLGSLRFSEDRKVYRIDRCFDHSTTPLTLTCETDAREYQDPQGALNELLGGISESAFINTVFIPQMKVETDEALAEELRRYMINSDTAMDGEVDVTKALQTLRREKKTREQQLKKDASLLDHQIEEKQKQADQIRAGIEVLKRQNGELTDAGRSGGQKQKEPAEQAEDTGRTVTPGMRRLLCGMFILAAVLTVVGIFLSESMALSIFLGIFTVLFGAMAIGVPFLLRPESEGDVDETEEEPEAKDAPPDLWQEIKKSEDHLQEIQQDLEVLYQQHAGSEGRDTELEALTLAIDRICEISSGIFQTNGGQLNETASKILSEITGGRYRRIAIDDTGEIRIFTSSRSLKISQVSGGTMQQIYFSERMAAGDLFCRGEVLPVILDETFAMYDDERLKAVLLWLKKSGRQVILFTCQRREREILKQL